MNKDYETTLINAHVLKLFLIKIDFSCITEEAD